MHKNANPTDRYGRLHSFHLPTPLEAMDRLSLHLGGPHLFIKRDDCTGLATGGSTARKLEFLMADAITKRASVVITQGPVQSNHALQTAAIASKLNMKCVLALETNRAERGNSLSPESVAARLERLYGAEIHYFPHGSDMEAAMQELATEHGALDHPPYVIPCGGSNPVGVLGYVNCAFEIVNQLREQGLRIDCIVLATGSGGTQAGLIVGLHLAGIKIPILGISVATPGPDQEAAVYGLTRRTVEYLGLEQKPPRTDVIVNAGYIGDTSNCPTMADLEATVAVARDESILLDPVSAGRAMHGLIDLIVNKHRFNSEENILFLHTGGNVGLFDHLTHLAGFSASGGTQ